MNKERTFSSETLEWDLILESLSGFTVSKAGKERIETLHPITDPENLRQELRRVTEMRDLLRYDEAFPLSTFADLRPYLKRAEVRGSFLRAEELRMVYDFLTMTAHVRDFLSMRKEKAPLLEAIGRKLV